MATTEERSTQTQIPTTSTTTTIKDIQDNTALWYKLHIFIYDLRNYRSIPSSQTRLDTITDASYIGLPYFTPTEVTLLKSTSTTIIIDNDNNKNDNNNDTNTTKTLEQLIEETLNERLERRMKKRVESEDFRVCAAHDLAPIFERVFDVNPKELARNKEFLGLVDRSGLRGLKDGEKWDGLPKKSFQKKKNKNNMKKG